MRSFVLSHGKNEAVQREMCVSTCVLATFCLFSKTTLQMYRRFSLFLKQHMERAAERHMEYPIDFHMVF